eukprot:gnl/TRDRNA2_/TRDRNA2_141241_c0_seq2.p2 gnl/TRDRNA2_/TRDRNA2_141241_c0~~gnl/TRDRNA2_/TRDRNA2_141241_c0_seq2.p2  ORF type:complete len:143 (-),score=25.88 gnl/TRDRNA2_/TRDRNA2_141241_c0_seq2:402-830(-)
MDVTINATHQPRDSIFRTFFRNLTEGMAIPKQWYADILIQLEEMGEEHMDDTQIVEMMVDSDYEAGLTILNQIIPYPTRMYTGEDAPGEEMEEEEDLDEDDKKEIEGDDNKEDEVAVDGVGSDLENDGETGNQTGNPNKRRK